MGTLCLTSENSNEQFVYTIPTKNVLVLEDFLTYFREEVKKIGIIIKK